ncbi:MAG: hypothetical protein A2W99_16310 [Bacteroidetes bacterium GWF2_33_16]|nr:MAG: hypothetical protein A2X00_12485 [Bacteroidetes bacterium GWE2_32_14]OFY08580.1 MAG: hypothetical protein A2W99_16310 [Bacteroidetes bacterium GWF2_33_16]
MIKKLVIISSIIIVSINLTFGQSITNSPYTRYGIGEIDRSGFGLNRAMGNLSTGLRKQNQINFLNPASISAQDTMSFIFDVGISGTSKTLSTNALSTEYQNFYFDHLAISFPIQRWWFTSIGIVPYSRIGYNIQTQELIPELDTVSAIYNHYGNGGINQVYLANSFVIFKGLSLGLNLSYLFGSLEQYNILSLDIPKSYSAIEINKISLNKFSYDIGVQYDRMLSEKYFLTLGLVYSNKIKFNGTNASTTLMAENFILYNINVLDYLALASNLADTVTSSTADNYNVEIPSKLSMGFTTGIKDKLTFGVDFSMQDWSNIKTLNLNDNFAKDLSYNFGIEYIPNKFALRNYFKLINYRAGFYYNTGYLKFDNEQISTYGITFGVGLPITNKTSINLFGSYGQRGTEKGGLIKEEFYVFGLNLTLYDFWFYKSKIQ